MWLHGLTPGSRHPAAGTSTGAVARRPGLQPGTRYRDAWEPTRTAGSEDQSSQRLGIKVSDLSSATRVKGSRKHGARAVGKPSGNPQEVGPAQVYTTKVPITHALAPRAKSRKAGI